MPYKSDPWYASKRLIAGIAAIVALVAGLLGVEISEVEIGEALSALGSGVVAVLVVWSKIREKGKTEDAE